MPAAINVTAAEAERIVIALPELAATHRSFANELGTLTASGCSK
jgi:hypothetical protein